MNSKLDWDFLLGKDEQTYRLISEKDYDRIVFSQAFRRLAHKTQVHPLAQNDHIHNRMSHSIEVSSVCRSITSNLFTNGVIPNEYKLRAISTVMAAGLGHDMGNPPFGHIGEASICKWVNNNFDSLRNVDISSEIISSYSSFDGNAQNFHIFNNYEYFKEKPLSPYTMATMVKYPHVAIEGERKSGYFSVEKDLFDKCFSALGLKNGDKYIRHPLSFLLEAADDICYAIMDIDDAIEMDLLETKGDDFLSIMKTLFSYDPKKYNYKYYREKRGEIIEKAIDEISQTYSSSYESIMNGEVPDNTDLIKLSRQDFHTINAIKELKMLALTEVFKHRRKVQYETASYSILHRILDNWLLAFKEYKKNNWKIEDCDEHSKKIFQMLDMYDQNLNITPSSKEFGFVQIIDYVSGCTDRFANEISLAFLGIIR